MPTNLLTTTQIPEFTAKMIPLRHDMSGLWMQARSGHAEHCNPLRARYGGRSDALASDGVKPPPPVATRTTGPMLHMKGIDH